MDLYLLRHGLAADKGPEGSGDAGRPLTEEGIAKMRAGARGLAWLGVRPDVLLSSPLLRARATAEIAARELRLDVQVADALMPGCDTARLIELLAPQRSADAVMVVGHEPDLSAIIGDLTGGSLVQLKKGGLALVALGRLARGGGALRWLLPPRILRSLRP